MAGRTGRLALLEQLRADGVRYIFGNPGTSEQGFLDALDAFPDISYILALHESVAVGIADGYARATAKPAIVQLHSGVGLGNGISMMYQAMRGHSPMVVFSGEAGLRYDALDAQMAADLVGIAKPVTKWATRVVDPSSVLRVVRRAVKMAATPPMGPVFVGLPLDILDAPNHEAVAPTSIPVTRIAPQAQDIARVAEMLAAASLPMIIVGDGIARSGAQSELVRVAELLGAEVWTADSSEVVIPESHPQFLGSLGIMYGSRSLPIATRADALLICGGYVFPEVFPSLEGVFTPGTRVIHIDLDPYEIAKNFPVDLGLVADPKVSLSLLAEALDARMTKDQRENAGRRAASIAARKERAAAKAREADRARRDRMPLQASRFMDELAAELPSDTVIFNEAQSCQTEAARYLTPNVPGQYYAKRGGCLGTGLPGTVGVKLANPDRTVVGFSADGAAMYTIQSLWTAAHYRLDAKFVILNNRSYRALKVNLQEYWRERELPNGAFPGFFDLVDPDISFVDLAKGMGVPGIVVERPEDAAPAIRKALSHPGPFLLDVVVDGEVPAQLTGGFHGPSPQLLG